MADPSGRVIENLRGRERLVTTLVGENPQARSKQTLDDRVQYPQRRSKWCRRNVLGGDELVEEEKCARKTGNIPSHVAQPPQSRSLEAVLWNGISNVIDGEVWQLELVPIGIE